MLCSAMPSIAVVDGNSSCRRGTILDEEALEASRPGPASAMEVEGAMELVAQCTRQLQTTMWSMRTSVARSALPRHGAAIIKRRNAASDRNGYDS
jgi:hypothetical protein